MTTIYGLYDPRDGALRYIGRTRTALTVRLCNHCWWARKGRGDTPRQRWVRELLASGLRPVIRGLREVPDDEADRAERAAILDHARDDLLNMLIPGGRLDWSLRAATEVG